MIITCAAQKRQEHLVHEKFTRYYGAYIKPMNKIVLATKAT